MSAEFRLDGHKLQYHPRLVADFLEGRPITPLNAEISLTDACNHRCLFCNFNYLGHKNVNFPHGRMPVLAAEMADAGVRTMTFAGAGEPLLHPDLFPSMRAGRALGMELALSSNGLLLQPGQMREAAELLTWIRFSVNGGTAESYAAVHRGAKDDFACVWRNIADLRKAKLAAKSSMTIGVQCVLLEENHRDIETLARLARETGADYFSVKHFFPREEGGYRPDLSFRAPAYLEELRGLAEEMSSGSFAMVVRDVGKIKRSRPYDQCLGLPFLVYIGENGLLYTCFSHHEDLATAVGNVVDGNFAALWRSAAKDAAIRHLNERYDKNECQANCRHHQINLWLHQLKNPPAHVNFI